MLVGVQGLDECLDAALADGAQVGCVGSAGGAVDGRPGGYEQLDLLFWLRDGQRAHVGLQRDGALARELDAFGAAQPAAVDVVIGDLIDLEGVLGRPPQGRLDLGYYILILSQVD